MSPSVRASATSLCCALVRPGATRPFTCMCATNEKRTSLGRSPGGINGLSSAQSSCELLVSQPRSLPCRRANTRRGLSGRSPLPPLLPLPTQCDPVGCCCVRPSTTPPSENRARRGSGSSTVAQGHLSYIRGQATTPAVQPCCPIAVRDVSDTATLVST